jgi:cytochrome b6-f complex iron-sulfur subunit
LTLINGKSKSSEHNPVPVVYTGNRITMTRKDLLLKVFLGGTAALVIPATLTSCSKDETEEDNGSNNKVTIDLSDPSNATLLNPGGTKVIGGIIVANKGSDTYAALEKRCTHDGCTVVYELSTNTFPCPCHGSVFSATGTVLQGPAVLPLKVYPVTKSGNILTIG